MLASCSEKTCAQCGKTKPTQGFNKNVVKADGLQDQCRECQASWHSRTNESVNAVSRLAYGIAGGSRAFYRLAKAERLAIRDQAQRLRQFGVHVRSAAAREASRLREGFVYVIRNDAWPDRLKIGSAVDAESRLGDAQTWDPHRRFYVAHSVFVLDRIAAEHRVHARLSDYRLEGEWFAAPLSLARAALDEERETPSAQDQQTNERASP
jgi:hypothetical protein